MKGYPQARRSASRWGGAASGERARRWQGCGGRREQAVPRGSEFKVGSSERAGWKVRYRQRVEDLVLVLQAVGACGKVLSRGERQGQEA